MSWLILTSVGLLMIVVVGCWYLTMKALNLRKNELQADHKKILDEVYAAHDRISALNESLAVEAQARSEPKIPEYQTGMWLPTDEQNAETERVLRRNEDHALYAPDQRPRSSRPSRPSGPISGRKS